MAGAGRPDRGPVVVAGAGVLGLTLALRLAQSGWRVTLHDPVPQGPSASRIAAGMLAPASEAVLDGAGPYALLLDARRRWDGLLRELDCSPAARGALHLVDHAAAPARRAAFAAIGGRVEDWPHARWPTWLGADPAATAALFTPDDTRIDAGATLDALAHAAIAAGVVVSTQAFTLQDARASAPVVVAAGWEARRMAAQIPELAFLTPIHGQLLRFTGGPAEGPVVRGAEGYLAPDPGGALFGASMDVGVGEPRVDATVAQAQAAAAIRLAPMLSGLATQGAAGVRASTPDGLPLVGAASAPGLWLAVGARRNGWLLAPLVAEILAAQLEGRDAGPWAARLDPLRFAAS